MIKIAAFECVVDTVNGEDDCNDCDDMTDFHNNFLYKEGKIKNKNNETLLSHL